MQEFRVGIPVRFRDLDAMGHVNNAVFLTYMETARVQFCAGVLGSCDVREIDFLVARVEIDYRRPILLGETATVSLAVEKIGRTSFTLDYVFRVGDELAAEARSVQVFIDRETHAPKPVPEDFRARVAQFTRPADARPGT